MAIPSEALAELERRFDRLKAVSAHFEKIGVGDTKQPNQATRGEDSEVDDQPMRREELMRDLRASLAEYGVLKQGDLYELQSRVEALETAVLGEFKSEIGDLLTLETLAQRVRDLETGRSSLGQGLRKKVDTFTASVKELDQKLVQTEKDVTLIGETVFGTLRADGQDSDDEDEDWLEDFRTRLAPGISAHLAGLQSRPELNGAPATLLEWHGERDRWSVAVGQSTLLVRSTNIVS